MINTTEIPKTPERFMDLQWVETDSILYGQLKKVADQNGLRLSDKPKALRGGGILGLPVNETGVSRVPTTADPELKSLEEFLSSERHIAVIPAFEGETSEFNRLIFVLNHTEKTKHFGPNFEAWKTKYAAFLEKKWKKDGKPGKCPVPPSVNTFQTQDGHTCIVTDYYDKYESLGSGEPDWAVHEADLKKLPNADHEAGWDNLLDALDSTAVPTEEFLGSDEYKNIPDSWLKEGNAQCALRNHEWWYNPARTYEDENTKYKDRLWELTEAINNPLVKDIYEQEFGSTEEAARLLKKMIFNNLPLYRYQNGTTKKEINGVMVEKDEKLLGKSVVTLGTIYPGQVHKSIDAETGMAVYMFTGGDRAQLYGLRGQMIDWLVSSCAKSPAHQKALIRAFMRKYGSDPREMRGLAMHVMYRCISEAVHFGKKGETEEAGNLVELTKAIMTGDGSEWDGAWDGVNTSMTETQN